MRRLSLLSLFAAVALLAACNGRDTSPGADRSETPGDAQPSTAASAPPSASPSASASPATVFPPAVQSLLDQAKAAGRNRYLYAIDQGATVVPTSDGRSFAIVWQPDTAGDGVPFIATIHGHAGWAFNEFFLWHQYARERGYGIVALQWWFGQGERFQDYYSPREVNRELSIILGGVGAEPGKVLFHGFSRGSANSYAVVAYDRAAGQRYYGLAIANAGKPGLDFPGNVDIESGAMGSQPLSGSKWVTFCGGKDEHPERDGCPGMREAATWIKRYGGVVLKAIEDPEADHGGFHHNAVHINAALDVFAGQLKGQ